MPKMKRLKRKPSKPLLLISLVYPKENMDTAKARTEMTIIKNPERASPRKANAKSEEIGKEGICTGRPQQISRPATANAKAPADEKI
jgi:hypothetical protein